MHMFTIVHTYIYAHNITRILIRVCPNKVINAHVYNSTYVHLRTQYQQNTDTVILGPDLGRNTQTHAYIHALTHTIFTGCWVQVCGGIEANSWRKHIILEADKGVHQVKSSNTRYACVHICMFSRPTEAAITRGIVAYINACVDA
jgi:hypothetical protein